jgi:hypothetical protein
MKRARVGVIAASVLAVATMAYAQKPDFSGTWAPDASAATSGEGQGQGRGRGMAGPMTVKHTGDTLTVETTRGENKVVMTYKLDGTESKNQVMGRGGQTAEATSVAKWDGSNLTIATKRMMNDQTVETTETWSLAGDTLTVEMTSARGSQKRVYKKGA